MCITIEVVVLLIVGFLVFLYLPYSPTRAEFEKITKEKAALTTKDITISELFTERDMEKLPPPVQKYFRYCGFLGTPKMEYMRASFTDVDFIMSASRIIKIDYTQFNLVERPERFALISSSLFGIPFEGLDSFEKGKGSMKGVLAKVFTLFNQKGENMDRASLVTWLAECLMVPNAALQDFVKWEPIDDLHAKAIIVWKNMSTSGVFTFTDNGELLSFRTGDRVAIGMDGSEIKADWSAYCQEYHSVNGIMQPKVLQSTWHYKDGDTVYFNENRNPVTISYF